MPNLTEQERTVVLFFCVVLFFGSILRFVFLKYPFINDVVNFTKKGRVYWSVDVNTASEEELTKVPYIGPYTARKIIQYREKKSFINSVDELSGLPGVRPKNFKIFSKYLRVKE